jgi:hypothetical protein
MPAASFSAGTGVTQLVFSVNPCYPVRAVFNSGSVKAMTEGGEEYVYRKGEGYLLHYVRFEGMPASDYDGGYDYSAKAQAEGTQSLINWFCSIAGSGTFTYQDPFGKAHQVSMADGKLDFGMTDNGLYDGVITLKEMLG